MKILKLLIISAFFALASCSKESHVPPPEESDYKTPPISGKFRKNVLIEDYTGTWCGNCPRVGYSIEKVKELTTKCYSVAIHKASSGSPDPFDYNQPIPYTDGGYPKAKINRTLDWKYPEYSNLYDPIYQTSNNTNLGIALNSTVASGNINLDVKIKFLQDYSNLKLVVYIVEDGLIYDQTNYTSFYGGVSLIRNFVHNDVLRKCVTSSILGDDLTGTTQNATVTKNFNLAMPSVISDPSKIKFVAFVLDSGGKSLNVREAHPNENQAFQVNP